MLHLLEKKEYQKHPGKLEGLQHVLFLLKTQRVRSRVKSAFNRLNQIFFEHDVTCDSFVQQETWLGANRVRLPNDRVQRRYRVCV